jgi:hypothetical protein
MACGSENRALEQAMGLSNLNAATVCDLIADINAANKAGGSNTITLTAPTTSPYVLTAVDNTTDGATGLPVISVGNKKTGADNLTIVGNSDIIERSTASHALPTSPKRRQGHPSLALRASLLCSRRHFGYTHAKGGAPWLNPL